MIICCFSQFFILNTQFAYSLGPFECPATHEHRQAAQQHPLRFGQQIVTPVDQRLQGLLARQRGATATGQQPEAVVQPRGNLFHHEHAHPRRRQLDRQRNAIEPRADLGERRGIRVRDRKRGLHRARPFREQLHCFILDELVQRWQLTRVGRRQRGHAEKRLAGNPERLAAAGQNAQLRVGMQQRVGQLGACVDQVLAIIQYQQHILIAQVRGERGEQRPAGLLTHTQHGGDCLRNERRIGQWRQLDQPDSIREPRVHRRRQLQRQAGLAGAAWPSERQQAGVSKRGGNRRQLVCAADEAGQLCRQVVRHGGDRGRRLCCLHSNSPRPIGMFTARMLHERGPLA